MISNFLNRLIQRALSRWRERELRADNTSVIVVHFEEAEQGAPANKIPRLDTPESEESETETKESTDSSQDSDKTPNQDSTLSSEKPTLVRKLAFRCSNPMQLTSCVNLNTSKSSPELPSAFNSLRNEHSSPVVSNCLSWMLYGKSREEKITAESHFPAAIESSENLFLDSRV